MSNRRMRRDARGKGQTYARTLFLLTMVSVLSAFAVPRGDDSAAQRPTGATGAPPDRALSVPTASRPPSAPVPAIVFAQMPEGPPIGPALARPTDTLYPLRACSWAQPVCVHASRKVPPADVMAALQDLERAAALLTGALDLPAPVSDGARGGDPSFDVYLVPTSELPGDAWQLTERDPPELGTRDRASAFARVRQDLSHGCARRHVLTQALVSAVQWGEDAGESAATREANSAYLAELTAPCALVSAELIDDFQAHPERAISAPSPRVGPGVGLAFPWYLDVALGSGTPGVLPLAVAALGSQRTPASRFAWENEPDSLDVLRKVLETRPSRPALADLWLDFAIARLFMGARDDGAHLPETAFAGAEGRVRFDWVLPYATLPRRVPQITALEPTGSTYLWVGSEGAPSGAQLAFRFEWEAPVPFRWALVRIGTDGQELSRVDVTSEQKSTVAERVLDDVSGLAGVVVVGVNVGDVRASEPFDPDEAPYEPHGFVVSVMRVEPASSPSDH
jgi:hypothetical protein